MEKNFYESLLQNIVKIMRDRNLTQAAMAEFMGVSNSQFTKVRKGEVKMSFAQFSKLATNLSMSEIDIITYPDRYVKVQDDGCDPVKALLQIELKREVKDQVLKIVFGEDIHIIK